MKNLILLILVSFLLFINFRVYSEEIHNSNSIGGATFILSGGHWIYETWGYCPITVLDTGEDWPGLLFYTDLSGYPNTNYKVHLNFYIENPIDFVFNIGNSPTNNGGCGDYWTFSNDSEVDLSDDNIYNGEADTFNFRICPNDYEYPRPLLTKRYNNLQNTFWGINIQPHIFDYHFDSENNQCINDIGFIRSSYFFNLGGPDREAGENDYIYWFAFNRCIDGYYRKGLGVTYVQVTFY